MRRSRSSPERSGRARRHCCVSFCATWGQSSPSAWCRTRTGIAASCLHWVLMALGQSAPADASYVALFSQFQSFLIEEYGAGRRTILIFDEAQNLKEETLEELRMFSNINADQDELIQMVLVGQPELREMIQSPNLVQFAQRVSSDCHIPAMSGPAVHDYITHRTYVAGGHPRHLHRGCLRGGAHGHGWHPAADQPALRLRAGLCLWRGPLQGGCADRASGGRGSQCQRHLCAAGQTGQAGPGAAGRRGRWAHSI